MVLLVTEECFLSSGLQLKAREQQEQTKQQTTNTELLPQCDVPLPAIWSSGTLTLFPAPSAALTGLALDAAL